MKNNLKNKQIQGDVIFGTVLGFCIGGAVLGPVGGFCGACAGLIIAFGASHTKNY